MAMLNLFGRKNRIKKQKRKIARTVQQSIPIDAIYKDGIFRTGRLFSKSWKFSDINYAVASDDDQLQMFLAHSAILNGLPTDAMAEITIYNRQLHNKVFEQITTPSDNPNYKKYTQELNGILCDKMSESNNIVHEKYITVATEKKNIEEARTFFTRVENDLTVDYAKISSKIAELGYKDRLRIFNDFFKTGENEEFDFDLKKAMAKGADFKDYIAPDSLEQLDNDTETLMSIGRKHLCNFATLKYQQEDGMHTVLPFGTLNIKAVRTLTTESTAVLSPYKTQEIIDKGSLYYGINAISHNLLMCNRKLLLNGNGFILGVSGSGKSFAAKMEILMSALFSNDDIIVIDVEREYGSLIRNLGGEVITLSASSKNHINALEINNDIDMDENPVSIKSEFLISLFDQLLKSNDSRLGGGVGAKDKSIIDRCAIKVYGEYLSGKSEYMPTLVDFRNELLRQPEDEAGDLALSLEIFTTGSLDAFAYQSDVNTNNRIVAYDILELGEQMKSIGLLIILDNIFNRVMANRRRGKYTRVYVDEAHLYFKNPYSANFLLKCWKRFRKYGGLLTGITQNISDCLLNETARGMLSNSEFLLLLNQAPSDRKDLSELLSISDTQMSYITNAGAGRGLIKVGGSIVPFINEFPTDTELYKLMSTKPGES